MEKTNNIVTEANMSILGWFYIIMILFMTTITIFASYIIINTVSTEPVFVDNADASRAISISQSTILSFDNLMLFVIIGLSLFVIISSSMVLNHPAFFIVSFVLLLIAIVFSAIMSNTFWTFSTSSNIQATANLYPKIKFLMEKMPIYILFMGMAASVAMYLGFTRQ